MTSDCLPHQVQLRALEERKAALETALQNRQVELEDARAELGAVSSEAQIASSLLAAEIGGLEAQCEHKIRHSRELAMSRRPAARM